VIIPWLADAVGQAMAVTSARSVEVLLPAIGAADHELLAALVEQGNNFRDTIFDADFPAGRVYGLTRRHENHSLKKPRV
jgi:hypothetical protein